MFSEGEEEQELMFRLAVERINADPTILPRSSLVAQVERIGKEDSFHADKKGKLQTAWFANVNFVAMCESRLFE